MTAGPEDRVSPNYPFKNKILRAGVSFFDSLCRFFVSLQPQAKISFEELKTKESLRILAIRLDHLGDVLMTRPALSLLRRTFPNAQIDLLISSDWAPLLEREKGVDHQIKMPYHWFSRQKNIFRILSSALNVFTQLRRRNYDLAIDFRGDLRNILLSRLAGIPCLLGYGDAGGGPLLSIPRYHDQSLSRTRAAVKVLEPLGINLEDIRLEPLAVSPEVVHEMTARIHGLDDDSVPRIGIHPGAGYPSKLWPSSHFQELIRIILSKTPARIFILGTREEKDLLYFESSERVFDLRGRIDIYQLPALLQKMDYFIGNDSGPAHMAAAQGKNGIVVFSGANDVRLWAPHSESMKVLTHPVPCSPCESRKCPLGHHECMVKITVQAVWLEIQTALFPALKVF